MVRNLPLTKEERLAKWFNDAKIGWFPHWSLDTGHPSERKKNGYVYLSAEVFERAETESGWSADKWVQHAKKMHAKYISIATFHSRLGYIKIWPTKVPGSMHTHRDFLGELIEAADREGIKVLVYITGDPLWWNNNKNNQDAPPPSWLP